MRKGRFAGLSDSRSETVKPLSIGDLLLFDFLAADDRYNERIAFERARSLAYSAPFLTVTHLVCGLVLIAAAFIEQGAGGLRFLVPPLAALLLLDVRLWLLSSRRGAAPPRPHLIVRLTALYAILGTLFWIMVAAAAVAAGAAEESALFAIALSAGLTATIVALMSIPGLVMVTCLAAMLITVLFAGHPLTVTVSAAFMLSITALSLLRARDALLAGHRRMLADWQADRASRFVEDFEKSAAGWFWETDADGALTYVSAPLATQLGGHRGDLIGRKFAEVLLVSGDGRSDAHESALAFHLSARFPFTDVTVTPEGGEGTCWALSGRPNFDEFGRFLGFRGIGTNLSEERRKEVQSKQLARHDSLTGLPNRAQMESMLREALANSDSRKQGCSLFLIDLDHFKQVNDTLGHPVGDQLLKEAAQRFSAVFGEAGQVGRIGGDEFKAILPGIEEEGRLAAIAERLISEISNPYIIHGHTISIGVSAGIAIARPGKTLADALVKEADLALYAAKGAGRGTYRFFEPAMHAASAERKILENDLRDAVSEGQIKLVYQPIVSASTEDLAGFEVLMRWAHPTRGLLAPADFLPLAESSGTIVGIGEWVIRNACAEAVHWPEYLCLAINISSVQFDQPALPGIIASALAASGLDPDRLELEVTEEVISGSPESGARLARLKALGVRIALDDFGTGRSSVVSLQTAPLDRLKIDRSFISAAIPEDGRGRVAVGAVVALAQGLNMDVTAEGAETRDELAAIRALGFSEVQGFLFGRPLAAEDARKLAVRSQRVATKEAAPTRPPRHSLIRRGTLLWQGREHAVRLRNISAGGAMIEADRDFDIGDTVELDLSDGVRLTADVRWCQDGRLGLKFNESFDLQRLGQTRRGDAKNQMLRPDYLKTERNPHSPWAARYDRLSIKDVRRR